MTKIAILTESCTDLTARQQANPHIFQLPLYIIFEGQAYKENEDISQEKFYSHTDQMDELPTTSQPTPHDYTQKIEDLLQKGYDHIIIITLSKKLSGSYQSAQIASQDYGDQLSVFASQTGSVGEGLLVEAAGQMVLDGDSPQLILEELSRLDQQSQLSAVVVSVKNLVKSGRLPKIAGRIQSFLGLKFVINLQGGQLNLLKQSRQLKRAIDAMEKDFEQWYKKQNTACQATIFHVNDQERGQAYLERFQQKFPAVQAELASVGPVIGTHASTGAIGIAAIPRRTAADL